MNTRVCKAFLLVIAALYSAALLVAALFPAVLQTAWMTALGNGVCDVLAIAPNGWLTAAMPWVVALCAYALAAVLWYAALPRRLLAAPLSASLAVFGALLVGQDLWVLLAAFAGGAALGLAVAWCWCFAWRKFPKIFNRETVSYVVFGALTTVVNIVSYMVAVALLPVNTAVATTIAWVLSVLFAYVVNKLFVFRSRTKGAKALLWEAGKFVGARVFSYIVDVAGMVLLVDVIHVPDFWAKVATNIIVLIMNYFFSKLIIFKNKASE